MSGVAARGSKASYQRNGRYVCGWRHPLHGRSKNKRAVKARKGR